MLSEKIFDLSLCKLFWKSIQCQNVICCLVEDLDVGREFYQMVVLTFEEDLEGAEKGPNTLKDDLS